MTFLVLSLAGGLGAAMRLIVDGVIRSSVKTTFPIGTTVINVVGSLALGLITGLAATHLLSSTTAAVLGAGLLGGFTTFSTASFETVRLVQQRRYVAAAANGIGMLAAAVGAALLGLWIGSWL
jgi:CrcB protein